MKTPMQLHPTMKGELRAGALHHAATAPEGLLEMSSGRKPLYFGICSNMILHQLEM